MHLGALTQTQAASLLGVTTRALRDWHDAPRNKDSSYPGPALVAYYVAKVTGGEEYDDQRQRLAAAQAEKVEHENAVRRGQLADMVEAERRWTDYVANARAKLLGVPSKLGARLVNIGDANVITVAIRAEIYAALVELSGPSRHTGDTGEGVEDVGAAADPDGERVGRPRAKALNGKQRRARPVADG
jgi:hypothetical protein